MSGTIGSDAAPPGSWPDPRKVIPHREPFLFIDRVVEMTEGRIVATRRFRAEEPFFAGHFPDRPVVPGVILLEGLAQTMAYFALSRKAAKQVFLVGIDKARFRSIVEPGHEVRYEVELGEARLGMLTGKGRVTRDSTRVADASITGYSGE